MHFQSAHMEFDKLGSFRMPLTETSNNCPDYSGFSPPQTKYPLIDTSVFKEPKSAEPDMVIPPEPLTPVVQKPPKTNEVGHSSFLFWEIREIRQLLFLHT